jgi:hypothetical protein
MVPTATTGEARRRSRGSVHRHRRGHNHENRDPTLPMTSNVVPLRGPAVKSSEADPWGSGQERPELTAPCSLHIPHFRFGFRKPPLTCGNSVGDTGFEPVTSSVSGKRATAAPIALCEVVCELQRWVRDLNPCTRICSPLPRLSANPPWRLRPLRADNETRTRDLNLGKVALYQLSYVRMHPTLAGCA